MNQYIATNNIYWNHIFDMYMLDHKIQNVRIGKATLGSIMEL
jgi:hypothetical protein